MTLHFALKAKQLFVPEAGSVIRNLSGYSLGILSSLLFEGRLAWQRSLY